MFDLIKNSLKRVYNAVTSKLQGLFSVTKVDEEIFQQLQKIMLEADLGVQSTKAIINELKASSKAGDLRTGVELKAQLEKLLLVQLQLPEVALGNVILLVGVNGSGKTTLASKLAYYYKSRHKKVLLVAADTFRAAAVDQLQAWAFKLGIDMEQGALNQDPAAVVYRGCEKFKKEHYDIVIIDTAGRLQTKSNLMQELGKIRRVVSKILPEQKISTLLAVDAMLGQNSLVQAQEFKNTVALDGVVLTKMDGTGKGGIVVAIAQQLKLPVLFISYGEQPDNLKYFKAAEYISSLINN